jgi:hypothetical protein
VWWLAIAGAAILGGAATAWAVRRRMLRRMARENDRHDRNAAGARAEIAQLRSGFHALAVDELVAREANSIVIDALRGMDSQGAGR